MSDTPEQPPAADGPAHYWLRPRTNRVLVSALGLIALGGLAWLIFAPKPWSPEIDTSMEARDRVRNHSFVVIGLWYGALINLFLTVGGLIAWKFRPREMCDFRRKDMPSALPALSRKENTCLFLVTAAIVILAGFLMWPRLSLSLWGDEEASVRRYVVGNLRRTDDGFAVLAPPWQRTIWSWDNGPNSHTLFNIAGRISHGPAATAPEPPDRFHFDERRVRLPSFLATLIMIAAAAWLTALLGAPRGSPFVALFLAFHPWILRYGSEARGYGLMMAFTVLAFALLLKALRSRRPLPWWLAFGVAEFLLLFSHMTGVYFLVPLNLAALWVTWSPWRPGQRNPFRVADVWRLAGANLFGAAISIQLMLPNALQVPGWIERTGRLASQPPGMPWIQDWLAYWTSGMPWHSWDRDNPYSLTLAAEFSDHPIAVSLAIGMLGLLLLSGIAALATRRGARLWLLPLLIPVPLMFLVAFKGETLLYAWYAVGFLPLAAIVAGIGFGALTGPARRFGKVQSLGIATAASVFALFPYGLVTQSQRTLVRSQSVEALGESVRETRSIVNPFHPEIDETLTLGFVHATQLYDPAMIYAKSDEQFVAALRQADESGKTLWVNAANLNLGRPVFPKAYALLDDRDVFEDPRVLHGLQIPCTRYLFRYKPGGLAASGSD